MKSPRVRMERSEDARLKLEASYRIAEEAASGLERTRGMFHEIKFIWSVLDSDCWFRWLSLVLDCLMYDDLGLWNFCFHLSFCPCTKPLWAQSQPHSLASNGNLDAVPYIFWPSRPLNPTEAELPVVPACFLSRWQITLSSFLVHRDVYFVLECWLGFVSLFLKTLYTSSLLPVWSKVVHRKHDPTVPCHAIQKSPSYLAFLFVLGFYIPLFF